MSNEKLSNEAQNPPLRKAAVIVNLTCCPNCGGTSGYYCLSRVSGIVKDNTTWQGVKENSNMNDSIIYKTKQKYYKCIDCHKNIAPIKS